MAPRPATSDAGARFLTMSAIVTRDALKPYVRPAATTDAIYAFCRAVRAARHARRHLLLFSIATLLSRVPTP
jgi:hypothetical protein